MSGSLASRCSGLFGEHRSRLPNIDESQCSDVEQLANERLDLGTTSNAHPHIVIPPLRMEQSSSCAIHYADPPDPITLSSECRDTISM